MQLALNIDESSAHFKTLQPFQWQLGIVAP
jgi:hypothetical protein